MKQLFFSTNRHDVDARPWRRRSFFAGLISACLLFWLYRQVNISSLFETIAMISPLSVFLLLLFYTAGQISSALKWRIFLQEAGIRRELSIVVRAYFLGMFVNTFGLGTVGGDVARSVAVRPANGERAAALGTVAADRIHGLFVLMLIGFVGFAIAHQFAAHRWTFQIGAVLVLGIWLAWLALPTMLGFFALRRGRLVQLLIKVGNAIPRSSRVLLMGTALSLVTHCLQIAMHILIATQFGLDIDLAYYFAFVPVVNVLSCLPISVNGLGVREGMYLLWLAPWGASAEVAAAFGAVWMCILASVSVLGVLAIGGGRLPKLSDAVSLPSKPQSVTGETL